ncbi:hypothetical protein [Agrobacterium tumefaciens]|uniref:hypothetical protein n=1 Tax=Agrobacterium tumefaciens TaxID=358 RepID=UPI001F1A3C70
MIQALRDVVPATSSIATIAAEYHQTCFLKFSLKSRLRSFLSSGDKNDPITVISLRIHCNVRGSVHIAATALSPACNTRFGQSGGEVMSHSRISQPPVATSNVFSSLSANPCNLSHMEYF